MDISTALSFLNPVYTHQPLCFVAGRLLRGNRVRYDAARLEEMLTEHPYFPSLLSVCDVFQDLGIDYQAFRTDIDTLIDNFERPVLVILKSKGNMFAVVEKVTGNKIALITEKGEAMEYDHESFVHVWDGSILDIESVSETATLKKHVKDSVYPLPLSALVIGLTAIIFSYFLLDRFTSFTFIELGYLLFSTVGICLSWLLVLQHLDKKNELVGQLCETSSKEGCGSVLNSAKAQLLPWLNMAEAGLIYFTGISLLLLSSNMTLAVYLGILAPMVSLYAIYLQAFVIKQWCKLCMAVHGVILVNFILAYSLYLNTSKFPSFDQFILFIIPAFAWLILKPVIEQFKSGNHYKKQYKRLKANPDFFKAILRQQPRYHIPEELKIFRLGNLKAEHEVVLISNPYCAPCGRAHAVLHEWLDHNLDFKITIIFSHKLNEQDPRRQFVERLSTIKDQRELRIILHDWFEDREKRIDAWAERHNLQKTLLGYSETALKQWLDLADVQATPTVFVNGFKLPTNYRLEEIRHLVREV